MEASDVARIGIHLNEFLSEFDDCFGRSEPRQHLRNYLRGQLGNLHRKSVEPIAHDVGTPVRTLQGFFERTRWDELRLRDRIQYVVARDHADPHAIGIIDESANPKKGTHTAGVKRQWRGRTGKADNCVVGVHTGYVAGDFQALLDGDLFLPEEWADDPVRRREAHVPEALGFRAKLKIAEEQVRRTPANGIRVEFRTFDSFYGRDGGFLDALETLGRNYVAEVPANFRGRLREPRVSRRPAPEDMRQRGRRQRFPRPARGNPPTSEARDLMRHSPVFRRQGWRRFRIRDGERGPMIREVRSAPFHRKHGDGLPGRVHTLFVARNVLQPAEIKYFVANVAPSRKGIALERLVYVAFSRWPIERVFQQAKDELGMDHCEMRGWRAIHRHLYVTQLSHLFCARERQRLREKNGRAGRGPGIDPGFDRGASAYGSLGLGAGASPITQGPEHAIREDLHDHGLSPGTEPPGAQVAQQDHEEPDSGAWNSTHGSAVLCPK
jgi:SRSO17 transposase